MSGTDGYIQTPPDAGGKRVDATEAINNAGILVERQRVEIPDEVQITSEWLVRMLVEQRMQNLLLAEGFGLRDNIDGLRDELSNIAGLDLTVPAVRELLTEDRTYYVNSNGSDSNDGLTVNSAFLTVQAAVNAVSALDVNGFDVTIMNGIATTTTTVMLKSYVGQTADFRGVMILGDRTTPANIAISVNGDGVLADAVQGNWFLDGMKFSCTGLGGEGCVHAINGSTVYVGKVDFGACSGSHMYAVNGATILTTEDYAITAAALRHAFAEFGGALRLLGFSGSTPYTPMTVTMSGVQVYSSFIRSTGLSKIESFAVTYTGGTITGQRYLVQLNSVIDTYGGGVNYFPGDVAGATATGGQYG